MSPELSGFSVIIYISHKFKGRAYLLPKASGVPQARAPMLLLPEGERSDTERDKRGQKLLRGTSHHMILPYNLSLLNNVIFLHGLPDLASSG